MPVQLASKTFPASICSPSRAERLMPAGGHRCQHRSLLGRGWPAAAPRVALALSPGGCHHPALSRTGSAADTDALRSSGAGQTRNQIIILHKKVHINC